jgi:protein TonB
VPAPALTQPSFNADYLQNPAPRYPPLARRMRQEGKVVLRVLVDIGGAASQIEVRNSSGSDVLDEAALEAVKRWRFVPARRGDQPVGAWVLVPITFTLQG